LRNLYKLRLCDRKVKTMRRRNIAASMPNITGEARALPGNSV
jgi:hypothetical protein